MERLKDLTPGQLIYTIFILNNNNGDYIKIVPSQRKIKFIHISELYNEIDVYMEQIRSKHFGTMSKFTKEEGNYDCVKTSDFIYCFSQQAFIRELNGILKTLKKTMATQELFFSTHKYYNEFMPKLIKLINSNKSRYAVFKL